MVCIQVQQLMYGVQMSFFLLKLEVKPELSNSRVSMPSPPSSASLRNLSKTFGDPAVDLANSTETLALRYVWLLFIVAFISPDEKPDCEMCVMWCI